MPLVAKGPKKSGTAEEEQNGKAKVQEVENEEKEESFVLVSNIPSSWHTHHLRWDQKIFKVTSAIKYIYVPQETL